jgi:hypothetical protein
VLKIEYRHKTEKDGRVTLAYYRYADEDKNRTVCELVGEKLVWYEEPDEFTKAVVSDELEFIQRDWFLEEYGIRPAYGAPAMPFDEWAAQARELPVI